MPTQEISNAKFVSVLSGVGDLATMAGKDKLYGIQPTAASRGDQIDNARLFAEKGYGLVLPQDDLTPESLLASVRAALDRAQDFVAAMESAESHDPAERIADLLAELTA